MPRKAATSIEWDVRRERWFIVQCLARNAEYLALHDKYEKLVRRHIELKNYRQSPPLLLASLILAEWRRNPDPHAPPPKGFVVALGRAAPNPLRKGEALALLQRARRDPKERRKLMRILATVPPPEPAPEEGQVEQEIIQLHRQVKYRFGLFYVWDPRPFRGKTPREIDRLRYVTYESIRIVRDMVPTTADVGPIDEGAPARDLEESQRFEDSRFMTFCDGGVDLYMIADVRQSSRRLRYDFERIVKKIERLKRSGKLKGLPERPRSDVWTRCLRVWDLRKAGVSNREIARKLFGTAFATSPKNAEVLASQYYEKACRWISLDWARSRVNATGSPIT
jgi:hypothetical protein